MGSSVGKRRICSSEAAIPPHLTPPIYRQAGNASFRPILLKNSLSVFGGKILAL